MKLDRRWKSLIHKVEHLKIELEDHKDEVKEYEADFTAALREAESALNPEQPDITAENVEGISAEMVVGSAATNFENSEADNSGNENTNDEDEIEDHFPISEDTRPDSMRKLWKAIASATHPDRTGGNPELTEIYKKASRAWTAGSYEDLFEAALEARVKLPDPDPDLVEMLEKRSSAISSEISSIEQSVLWMWGRASKEKKDAILQLFITRREMNRRLNNQAK